MSTMTKFYKLIKWAGTDIVNLITHDNPNMDTIDKALADNAAAGVTPAEMTYGGGQFNLTYNTDHAGRMIQFVASADYKKGDRFAVNGQTVRAVTPGGTELPAGAFVINAVVLCALNGGVLTVYITGGSPLASHPVGSIVMTMDDGFNPNTAWGGSWQKAPENAAPAQASALHPIRSQYGSLTASLTAENNGPHSHTVNGYEIDQDKLVDRGSYWGLPVLSATRETAKSGTGKPFNICGPRFSCNIWYRVA